MLDTPDQYNQLFTMHGVTMIFLYALPVLSGFSNYLWPLLLGSRDMAFPRLNAFSYWIFLLAGIFLYASFPLGAAPNDGWFNYVPYASQGLQPGPSTSTSTRSGMILLGHLDDGRAVNFVVTLSCDARARHVDQPRADPRLGHADRLGRQPSSPSRRSASPSSCCGWTAVSARISSTSSAAASRCSGSTCSGCSAIPGSMPSCCRPWASSPTRCRPSAAGRWSATRAVALATVATMMLGFRRLGAPHVRHRPADAVAFVLQRGSIHHRMPERGRGVRLDRHDLDRPAGLHDAPSSSSPASIVLFVIGGVSGFMTAAVPVDWQLTDTYFVVAHLHYVLIGINVFPVVGGDLLLVSRSSPADLMNERLGKWNFWIMFIGFNLGFFPMHIAGLLGMPRRIYTYPAEHRLERSQPRSPRSEPICSPSAFCFCS